MRKADKRGGEGGSNQLCEISNIPPMKRFGTLPLRDGRGCPVETK